MLADGTRYAGTSRMDPVRRHRLESLLESFDHPDMWTDEQLEAMYAGRLAAAAMIGEPRPEWQRRAIALRDVFAAEAAAAPTIYSSWLRPWSR